MADVMIFHYRDDDNFLSRMNPNAKLVALLSFSVVISSMDSVLVIPFALIPLVLAFAVRLPFREYLAGSLFFIIIALIMIITGYLSEGDVIKALCPAAAFLSMVLFSMLLTDSTMPDELARSAGSALSHVIGRSAYVLSAVIEITLSMIPLIIDSTVGMYEARKARGDSFLSHPIRSLCQFTTGILADLLDKAEVYIDALYSRGYDASKRRWFQGYRLSDHIVMTLSILLIVSRFIFL